MNITISGTREEMSQFVRDLTLDAEKILKILIDSKLVQEEEKVDDQLIFQLFEKLSFDTIYLAHIIMLYSEPHQKTSYGIYLEYDILETLKISERSAASRVGGARRVCKRMGINDVLFIRKRKKDKIKRYYLAMNAVSTLQQFIEIKNTEYRDFLYHEGAEYPEKIDI